MEDDDEFGDLYTDVLRPFQSKQPSPTRPIDLNAIHSDDEEEILYPASNSNPNPNPNPKFNFTSSHLNQAPVFKSEKEGLADGVTSLASDFPQPSETKGSESGRGFVDLNLMDESGIDVVVEESDEKDDVLVEKDEVLMDKKENFEEFDIDEEVCDTGIGDMGSGPLIPGITGVSNRVENGGNDGSGEGDDWDSDSEDDLKIVLNENNHVGMVMDGNGVMGSDDDEDEDGDPLVIVADSEPGHQGMEAQEWGEDAAQAMDGERKELGGDAGKVIGGAGVVPKIGYSNHVYHPYHSQFKYVRPGAAPIPGSALVGPAGAPGQVRPPVHVGPVAGRGRGDWRPLQKSFHPGFGPVWGNNTSGRGFGSGLDFTLPSHKTIFEVDVDSFEEKPWKLPGIDVSDFFNFSMNEDSWKGYCKQLEQLRLETTMQSKIRVYESGRTEQEYDPDLPPELAAAAAIHDISCGNANLVKMDSGQSDVSKGSTRVRPPLPTGRAIQVETSYSERLPSMDTRPPRLRDSDAIIEIVLQDSADDAEQAENDPSGEAFTEDHEIGSGVAKEDGKRFPPAYNGGKREVPGRTAPLIRSIQDTVIEGDGSLPFPPKAQVQYSPDSKVKNSAYPGGDVGTLHEARRTKGRAHGRSPNTTQYDSQKEDSVEGISGKSSQLSSPVTVGSDEELDVEHVDGLHDEVVVADGSSGVDREELVLDTPATSTQEDENQLHSVKKQKLSSRVEQSSSLQGTDDGRDIKSSRSRENSKPRKLMRDIVHNEHSTHTGKSKRLHGEGEHGVRGKGRDEMHEMEKHRLVEKVREDSYSHSDWDPYSSHPLQGKYEGIDRRKERENSDGSWHRQDVDPHIRRTRAEDTNKRVRGDKIGSRNRNKEDVDLQLRKQLENGNLRSRYDKDVESRRGERDGNLKIRYEDMDNNLHRKARKEEEYLRRDGGKEEILHGHRENMSSRPKRERDDYLDQHKSKRDDQVRMRDEDRHFARHKEDGRIQRERSERHRERDELQKIKQSHESLPKQEREDRRGGVRVKDEYKDSDRDYQFKDKGRHNEQLERRGQIETMMGEDVHARRNQLSNDERRSRQERASARGDYVVSGSDNDRAHERKHKENTRKSRESEAVYQNSKGVSKRNQEDQSGLVNDPVISRGTTERGTNKNEMFLNRHSSKKHKEHASSDDEQQDSRRGRSKLERWTSHKERDFTIATKKSSSSLKVKDIDRDNGGGPSLASKKLLDETLINQHPPVDEKDDDNPEIKNVDGKPLEDKHSDTVEKLKKRSERFKLPMPSEKEAIVIKKMESEPLPSTQSEVRADSEVKPERPARKRRWIGS
ncbi:FIP1[V]-like protein [Rhododendron vialii]|uniref:FIP1[V]-like protein n=1 Tax=Rhododendron vialii TaxID=182163 RepID=UPI00265EC9AD|nr:FIP1[V]-like protein [Rhododendron vialii]